MKKFIIVVVLIFVLLSALFYWLRTAAPQFHFVALESGNTIMALLSLSSYFIVRNQMNGNPQAFVRGVYSASFLKLMVCMISILVYVLLNKAQIHKPSVFALFGIYAVYTVTETWLLSKIVKA